MQKLIDICAEYGVMCDISFNANKTQCITFGGRNPQMSSRLGSVVLQWTDKLKYLGIFFCSNSCHVDAQTAVRKFYGSFNNVLSVLKGKARNELTAVYLMERYCLPILTYTSEIWDMTTSEYRKINIVWNNSFRK